MKRPPPMMPRRPPPPPPSPWKSDEKYVAYFTWLDEKHAAGAVMFTVRGELMKTFGLSNQDAVNVMQSWMATYSPNRPPEERVSKVKRADYV